MAGVTTYVSWGRRATSSVAAEQAGNWARTWGAAWVRLNVHSWHFQHLCSFVLVTLWALAEFWPVIYFCLFILFTCTFLMLFYLDQQCMMSCNDFHGCNQLIIHFSPVKLKEKETTSVMEKKICFFSFWLSYSVICCVEMSTRLNVSLSFVIRCKWVWGLHKRRLWAALCEPSWWV